MLHPPNSQPPVSSTPETPQHQVARLIVPGITGFYTHVEITEIFAIRDDEQIPFNVFSILVAEEREGPISEEPRFVGGRIRLETLPGWMFGIQRTVRPIAALPDILKAIDAGTWRPSGKPLRLGSMVPVPAQFVPPDSSTYAPWNNVLKNNFWCGSHVFEWADTKKTALLPLIQEPRSLSSLSEAVQKELPLRLAGLSDRLGNVTSQIPVTVLIATFGRNRLTGAAMINVEWHPKATLRPLRASCERRFDNIISGYVAAEVDQLEVSLPMADGPGMQHGLLWDDKNKLILAATGATGFISAISMNMETFDPEPRVFSARNKDGSAKEVRVGLSHSSGETLVKPPTQERGEDWTRRRIYREDANRLATERRFVQYRPTSGQVTAEHEKALKDVRLLLNQYGKKGAWLWDPFLSGDDLLKTLFHCRYAGVDLRALTSGQEPSLGVRVRPTLKSIARLVREWLLQLSPWRLPRAPAFAERQHAVLDAAAEKPRGLRLEYRIKRGDAGWAFHDRFLIFPKAGESALAWSLGTSVNSLGKHHHILQQVDNGQLVADAFNELWESLDQPEHLVWKTP